jgi:hypothetical protein
VEWVTKDQDLAFKFLERLFSLQRGSRCGARDHA